ncbi:MAG: 30S ribosomal protein S4 [Armatimonadetes bacterium]|nr:30S ribosomal protein S4 [Armatimonadota bacterium]
MVATAESVCRLCRREGAKLFLKGDRCYTRKCAFERRPYAPGQHGQAIRRKVKEYGVQLREKQKLRRIYGVTEGQFRGYMREAMRQVGITGEVLLQLLELRLDNAVYRLGFASSRRQARELVSHAHFTVNGRKVNTASYMLKPGDVVEVKEASRGIQPVVQSLESSSGARTPEWMESNAEARRGAIIRVPTRQEIDTDVHETLIVEFYSR